MFEAALREGSAVAEGAVTVAVSLDGVMVAMKDAKRADGSYAEAKARHLPIGSGVVKAACKTLVTQRLWRSGMRWRHAGGLPPSAGIGGQAILTLRALIQSRRFDSAWELLSGTYRREVTIPNNVAPFPCKRAA